MIYLATASAITIICLLIFIWILLRIRRKQLANTLQNTAETITPAPIIPDAKPSLTPSAEQSTEPVQQTTKTQPTATADLSTPKPIEKPAPVITKIATPVKTHSKSLPQDATLKRHYLTHLQTIVSELHQPRPTDSMLCRHYDAHLAALIEQCLENDCALQNIMTRYQNYKKNVACTTKASSVIPTPSSSVANTAVIKKIITPEEYSNKNIPQDATLKRHYITELHAMLSTLNQPCPTDSCLCRHYQTEMQAKLELCLNDEHAEQQLREHYQFHKKNAAMNVKKTHVVSSSIASPAQATKSNTTSKIPEDSMLKRHFLTQLYAQVAADLPPRPTECSLRRHYDTLFNDEVEKRLVS